LSLYADETSELCHWHINEAHYLESWGDVRAADGTVSLLQPLIAPLYGGTTAWELLALLTGQPERTTYEVVRAYWRGVSDASSDFETGWRRALHDGLMHGTALPPRSVTLRPAWTRAPGARLDGDRDLEIVFRPDPTVFDGRFANNGWLQELPKPLTKLTWDNVALISPATAVRLGLAPSADRAHLVNEQVVELHYQGRTVAAPVWVLPG